VTFPMSRDGDPQIGHGFGENCDRSLAWAALTRAQATQRSAHGHQAGRQRTLRAPFRKKGPAWTWRMRLRPLRLGGWGADGEAVGVGRAVGVDGAADPQGAEAAPVSGPQADRRPQSLDGDLVRVADGDPVGVLTPGD